MKPTESDKVLWWIAASLCGVLSVIYYFILYFTSCEGSTHKELALKREVLF